jgi:cytoskeletal protein RodZ
MTNSQTYNDDNLLSPEFLEQLKQERLARGISLAEVAEKTNIREVYIEAIENGDFLKLPGGVYNKAYVRSISEYLGIRPSMAEILKNAPKIEGERISIPDIDPTRYEIIPNKFIVVASVVAIFFVYGIYATFTSQKPSDKIVDESTPVVDVATQAEQTEKQPEQASAANTTAENKISPDVTISVIAIGGSKVKLTSATGEVFIDKPMKYGETKIIAGEDNLMLTADAPQNIEIYLDGNYVGSSSNFPPENGAIGGAVKIQVAELLKKITR